MSDIDDFLKNVIARSNAKLDPHEENDIVQEISEEWTDGERRAYENGHETALDENDDIKAEAVTHLDDIVDSFKRGDMPDVRSRLMDFGQLLGLDVWIPSR